MDKILLLSEPDELCKHIILCLKENTQDVDTQLLFEDKIEEPNIVIINLLSLKREIVDIQIDEILKSKVKKIILLENALDIYLNCKNALPFSVYSNIVPLNEVCKCCLEIEKKVVESNKNFVIFRISEMYGVSTPKSLINNLLFFKRRKYELENCMRDFIYDGDVISAIEISLKKDVCGLFDIASGKSIELKKLVELIKRTKQKDFNIKWKRKDSDLVFNCANFKYYKWEPIVDIEMGIQTLFQLGENYGNLQSTRNF
jgi:nucleoside-diphosphate-sugar epimerase